MLLFRLNGGRIVESQGRKQKIDVPLNFPGTSTERTGLISIWTMDVRKKECAYCICCCSCHLNVRMIVKKLIKCKSEKKEEILDSCPFKFVFKAMLLVGLEIPKFSRAI